MNAATESKDPESLEREVDVKRANLNRTLAEVEQRFSPNHLMEQTVEYFGEHGGDIAKSVSRSIKDNPLPLLLTGVGIAWLISSQSRGSNSRYPGSEYRDSLTQWDGGDNRFDKARIAYAQTNRPIGDLPSGSRGDEESIDDFRERVIHTSVEHAEHMEYQYQQAQQSGQQLYMRSRQHAQSAAETGQQLYTRGRHHAQSAAQSATETARNFMQEQPLAAGALGLAAGALIGALLPSTRSEDELVGSHADSIKSAAARRAESASQVAASQLSDSVQTLREKGERKLDEIKSKDTQAMPV